MPEQAMDSGPLPAWARPRVIWAAGASGLALLAVVFALWRAREVVTWLGIALLLALTLDIPVRALERRRVPRGAAVLAVLLCALCALVALVVLLAPRLAGQAHALVRDLPALGQRIGQGGMFGWLALHLGHLQQLGEALAAHAGGAAGSLLHLVRTASRLVFATVTVFVLAAYMLVSGQALVAGLLGWLPPERRPRWQALTGTIRWAVGRYVAGLFLRASLLGVLSAVTLALLHVPYFLPLGLVLTMLGVLPVVGPILGGVLMAGAALAAAGPKAGAVALLLYVAFQQADSHVLSPIIQRWTVRMNPLVTVVAGLLGVSAGGVLGAALALPLAAVLQIVVRDARERRQQRWGEAAPAEAGAAGAAGAGLPTGLAPQKA
jgi:predicted PurR-regulated permease PerM